MLTGATASPGGGWRSQERSPSLWRQAFELPGRLHSPAVLTLVESCASPVPPAQHVGPRTWAVLFVQHLFVYVTLPAPTGFPKSSDPGALSSAVKAMGSVGWVPLEGGPEIGFARKWLFVG